MLARLCSVLYLYIGVSVKFRLLRNVLSYSRISFGLGERIHIFPLFIKITKTNGWNRKRVSYPHHTYILYNIVYELCLFHQSIHISATSKRGWRTQVKRNIFSQQKYGQREENTCHAKCIVDLPFVTIIWIYFDKSLVFLIL